ncbi:MAG TPA: hypothetical protein PK522_10795 [Nitrosomonas sp.]|nr:hypothetical protein [Nitrosomonas sp.]
MTISGGIHGGIEVEFNPSGLLLDGREYFVFEGLFYAKNDDQLVFVGDALPIDNNLATQEQQEPVVETTNINAPSEVIIEEVTSNLPPQESSQSSESFNLFKPSTWL